MPMDGGADLRVRLDAMAARARDLTPAMKVVGEEIVLRTTRAFRARQSPAGDAWAPLARSTLARRAAKLPGAKRKTKRGGLTQAAKSKRSAAVANPAAITPLVDTGRLRNSAQQYKADKDSVTWSVVGYGGPHMAGSASGRPPKRSFSVFEPDADGGWRIIQPMLEYAVRSIERYVGKGAAK